MSKTPYTKLTSEDILSAHITGLGYAINNIETVLNMDTTTITDVQMDAVKDMSDSSDRYRIYECSKRCWLTSPAPVIKRNGTKVASTEYAIQPAYGTIVFHQQQKSSDSITVSATVVNGTSAVIKRINDAIAEIKNGITGGGSSSDGTTVATTEDSVDIGIVSRYITNSCDGGKVPDSSGYTSGGMAVPTGTYEAFPFIIKAPCKVDHIRIECMGASVSGVFLRACIYKADPVTGNPKEYVKRGKAKAEMSGATGYKYVYFDGANLEPGLYYIAMYFSGTSSVKGLKNANCIGLNLGDNYKSKINNSGNYPKISSIRTASGQPADFPENTNFPTIQYYCGREATASPQIKIVEQS
ncbi:hypothetical protein [uncultured Clostridium sp.]|uniref:hypothetical protein n=1 Tax=uncultured Clostridium sp. TaxID=59620 RepID=UPI0025FFD712|nr:hypothetical protein [uncultured Clostridium sp.]